MREGQSPSGDSTVTFAAGDDPGWRLDWVPLAYLQMDAQFRVTYLNRAAEQLFGWTRHEILGRDPFELVVAPEYVEFVRALRDLMAKGELEGPSLGENVTKDGRRFLSEWTNVRILAADGSFAGMLSTCVDVTERTRMTQALEHSEQRYRTLIDCLPDGILVTRGATIAFVNPAGVALFGAGSAADLIGKTLVDLVHPDYHAIVSPTGDIAQASRMQRVQLVAEGGRFVWAEIASIPLADDPGAPGSLIVLRDTRERDALEQELRQKQKLETVGQLAGGIAHDFNNLLTVILSACSLLARTTPEALSSRQELGLIREAAESAASLIRQLLAFARRQNVQPAVFDLNQLVVTAERMLQRVIGEDVVLEVEAASPVWPVRADPRQIEQLVVNLAANARAAMPSGGRLSIRTRNIEVGREPIRDVLDDRPGRYVELAVSDTGIGMDAETLAHIFEPFFTTREAGSGLGLATCYGIVSQAGGSIRAESQLGEGTLFRIWLPAAVGPHDPSWSEPDEPRSSDGGTETILIVDDNLALRNVAARILEQAGYRVLSAGGSNEAIELSQATEEKIDLLLTDVLMPGMSGAELAPLLSEQREGLAVLYMSGYADDRLAHHGAAVPPAQFIQKPFTPRALLGRIRAVLDARHAIENGS